MTTAVPNKFDCPDSFRQCQQFDSQYVRVCVYRLTYEGLAVQSLHPVEALAVRLVLAVVRLPLLAEEGVAHAAAPHRAVFVTLRPVPGRRGVRAQEREVRLARLSTKNISVTSLYV